MGRVIIISRRELRNDASLALRSVERFTITANGRPVAELRRCVITTSARVA